MYFTFQCDKCGKKLKVKEDAAGRKAACPYCKTSLVVPSPSAEPESPLDDPTKAFEGIGNTQATSRTASSKPKGKPKEQETRKETSSSGGGGWSERTDVSMIRSLLYGLAMSAGFMLLVLPLYLAGFYFGDLFYDRGGVPYALVLFLGWSIAILILKRQKVKRQRASMLFDLLPNDLADDITDKSVGKFVKHIHELPVVAGESFLVARVLRGLEHFRVRNSNPEVVAMLASQSEIDANAVQSSYSLLNVFIWAIPILGFIGTVIGISAAVGNFSGSMDAAGDVSALKDSLNGVTGGLATAFDTTLVALVMSMIVMFPTSSMQKSEEDLLNSVDEYCNENLLKRLNDGQEGGGGGRVSSTDAVILRKAIDAAMAPHHAELKSWNEKLDSVGSKLTGEVVKTWGAINKEMQRQQKENAEQAGDVDGMAVAFQRTLKGMAEQTEVVHTKAAGGMTKTAGSLKDYCTALEKGLAGLNDVLEKLGEQQVVIQAAPRRRGWFFGRKGGN